MAESVPVAGAAAAGNATPPAPVGETIAIARLVLLISGITILALSVIVLLGALSGGTLKETSQYVFNALLPLLGTWVGTVLAYYFSRQNFEAANQSVARMVNTLTTEQKLAQIFVEKEMLRPSQIVTFQLPAGKTAKDVKLADLRKKLGPGITRIPVVDANGVVQYIVHQSGLFKFVSDSALSGKAKDQIEALTLQDLVEDAELKNWVANIVYIPEKASVAEAKTLMEAQKGCQDLIVTKTGSKMEPMLGWMTNVHIGSLSKA